MSAQPLLAALGCVALLGLAVLLVAALGPFPVLAGLALIGTIGAVLAERFSPDPTPDEEESA
jgi:hypothetical protein